MGKVNKFGKMVQSTRVNGVVIKLMAKEFLSMCTEILMRVIGLTIKLTGKVCIYMRTVRGTKALGTMICNMDLVEKPGLITARTKVTTIKVKNREKAHIFGQMAANT